MNPKLFLHRPTSVWLMAFGAVFCAAGANAAGYMMDPDGGYIRDNAGNCIRTADWSASTASHECETTGARTAAPDAPPAVIAEEPRLVLMRLSLNGDEHFRFGKSGLQPGAMKDLDRVAAAVRGQAAPEIRVTGHTDRIGDEQYNMALSRQRAAAVAEYLTARGVASRFITVQGKGETEPLVSCEGETGKALIRCLAPNRRTEVVFSSVAVIESDSIMVIE